MKIEDMPVNDSEDYRMDFVKRQIFTKNGKEIVPPYLKCDLPS